MSYKNVLRSTVPLLLVSAFWASSLFAHCEIPCGIYDDKMRIDMMEEYIVTIEKSMNKIKELADADQMNHNQMVRWVTNKEEHANRLQHIITQYFMTQRIKPVDQKDEAAVKMYQQQLTLLHLMLVHAMKCKQTTEQEHIQKLRDLMGQFYQAYFVEKDKEHLKEHK